MKSDMQELQDLVTMETLGVFWITPGNLFKSPRMFDSVDYLLDGLLTRLTQQNKNNKGKNFFVSTNFGKPFFIGHLDSSLENMKSELLELMELVKSSGDDRKTILVMDFSETKQFNVLKNFFSDFKFVEFPNGVPSS